MKESKERQIYIGRPCTEITEAILAWIAVRIGSIKEEKPLLFILSGGVLDEHQIKEKLRKIVDRGELQKIYFDKALSVGLLSRLFPGTSKGIISLSGVLDWTGENSGIKDAELIRKVSFDLEKISKAPKNLEFLKKKYSDVVDIEDLYSKYKIYLDENNLADSGTACNQLVNIWSKNVELSKSKSSEYSGIVIYDAFKLSEDKLRVLNLLIRHQERFLIAGDKCSNQLAHWRNLPNNIFDILDCIPADTSKFLFKENVINTKNTNDVLNDCYSKLGDNIETISHKEQGEVNEIGYIESEDKLEEFVVNFAKKYPKEKLLFCINNRNKVSELSYKTRRFSNLTIETPYMAPKFEIDRTVLFINDKFFSRYDPPMKKVRELSRMLANALPRSKGKNLLLVIGPDNCELIKDYISTIKKQMRTNP